MKTLSVTFALAFAIAATNQQSIRDAGQTQGPPGADPKQIRKAQAENELVHQMSAAMNARDWQQAISILQRLIAMEPARWDLLRTLGDIQFSIGEYDQAIASYQKSMEIAESNTTLDPSDLNYVSGKEKSRRSQDAPR